MSTDRRAFLKALSAATLTPRFNPVSAIIASLAGAQSLRSRALAASATPKNYVFLYLELGISRWGFDLPINPYEEGKAGTYVRNPGLNNCFQANASGALVPAYANLPVTAGGETIYMPPLWQCNLPRPDGTSVPMSGLLANMLIMRGINMGIDGHPNNAIRQILPVPGAGGLNGLVADLSSTPLPAIDLSTKSYLNAAYESQRGVGQSSWDPGQQSSPLEQLLSPFTSDPALASNPAYLLRKNVDASIEAALAAMQAAAQTQVPDANSLFTDRLSARKLLQTSFANLGDSYSALLTKYQGLISKCGALRDLAMITTSPLPTAAMESLHCNVDMTAFNPGNMSSSDIRNITSASSSVAQLAEGFATTEYMLLNGLSAASVINAGPSTNLSLNVAGAPATFSYYPDEHDTGTAVHIIVTAFYYRSIAACLYEFISSLKAKGLFNNTVIQIGNEFSRAPRADGSGSDHNLEGGVTSVLSGAVTKPCVIGHCYANQSANYAGNSNYPGSFGAGTPMLINNATASLNIGNVTSTMADLLGVVRPAANFLPVFSVSDSSITPAVEKARNV